MTAEITREFFERTITTVESEEDNEIFQNLENQRAIRQAILNKWRTSRHERNQALNVSASMSDQLKSHQWTLIGGVVGMAVVNAIVKILLCGSLLGYTIGGLITGGLIGSHFDKN